MKASILHGNFLQERTMTEKLDMDISNMKKHLVEIVERGISLTDVSRYVTETMEEAGSRCLIYLVKFGESRQQEYIMNETLETHIFYFKKFIVDLVRQEVHSVTIAQQIVESLTEAGYPCNFQTNPL